MKNINNYFNKKYDQDHFEVLRKIENNPNSSQRKLAKELGFSLGKLNYCIKSLQEKVLVKKTTSQKTQINLIIFMLSLQKV